MAVPLLVLTWAVLVTSRHAWAGDFRLHLATVEALRRDLWSPADPLVGAAQGSPYYSPYTVMLGVLAGVTGAEARTVLEGAGVVSLAVLLAALWRLCRHLRAGVLAPVCAIVCTLLLWGLRPPEWSGFLSLTSLSWTLAYPSIIATALMLLTWDAFVRCRDLPARRRDLVALCGFATLVVLVHPFTALNTAIGLVALGLADPRRTVRDALGTTLRTRPWWFIGMAAAAPAILLLWPWSDVFSLFGAAGELDETHRTLIEAAAADWGFGAYGLALVGLPALVTAHRRPFGRELQALFLLSAGIVALGALTGRYGFARVIPVPMLALHLALAGYLGRYVDQVVAGRRRADRGPVDHGPADHASAGRGRAGRVLPAVTVLAVAVAGGAGVYGNSGGLIRAYWAEASPATLTMWKSRSVRTGYDPLLPSIRPGDVVMSDDVWAGRLVNGRGAYSVVPAWPYPYVDEDTRRADSAAFFAAGTAPGHRLRIAERYGVTCVLVNRNRAVLRPGALPGFGAETRAGRRVLRCHR